MFIVFLPEVLQDVFLPEVLQDVFLPEVLQDVLLPAVLGQEPINGSLTGTVHRWSAQGEAVRCNGVLARSEREAKCFFCYEFSTLDNSI